MIKNLFTKEISGTDGELCQTLGKEIKNFQEKREGENKFPISSVV